MTDPVNQDTQKPETLTRDEADRILATAKATRQERDELKKRLDALEKADSESKTAKEREELERKGEYEKLRASIEAEKANLVKELSEARATHEQHLKESLALSYLAPIAATPKTLEALKREFMGGLEVVQGKVVVKSDPAKTPEQFAKDMASNPEYAPFLKAVNSSGGGANTNSGAGSAAAKPWKDLNLTERGVLFRTNPDLAKAMMENK